MTEQYIIRKQLRSGRGDVQRVLGGIRLSKKSATTLAERWNGSQEPGIYQYKFWIEKAKSREETREL